MRGISIGAVLVLATATIMGATPVSGTGLDAGITNLAPTLTSVTLTIAGVTPGTSATPVSGTTSTVTVTIIAADLNGYQDISTSPGSVTVQVLKPDGTQLYAAAAATLSSGSGVSGTWTYAIPMWFYEAPALTTNLYKAKVVVTDTAAASVNNAPVYAGALYNYAELVSSGVDASSVSFGSTLTPGTTSSIQSLGILNKGNVQMDARNSGTDLAHASLSASIAVGQITYGRDSSLLTGTSTMTTSPVTDTGFDLAPGAGTANAGASKSMYYELAVPSGSSSFVPSGTYTGTLTVSAVDGR